MSGGGEAPDYTPLAEAQKYAANLQKEASDRAIAEWKAYNAQQREDFRPYREHGLDVLDEIQKGMAEGRWTMPEWEGGHEIPEWDSAEFEKNFRAGLDPSYQFRLDEGLKAIRRGASASGQGGATLKALTRYGQNLASTEYGRARQRAVDDYRMKRQSALDRRAIDVSDYAIRADAMNDEYNRLAGQLGMGMTATDRSAAYGSRATQAMGAADMAGASAIGAGAVGAENAIVQGQWAQYQASQQRFNNLMSIGGLAVGAASALL